MAQRDVQFMYSAFGPEQFPAQTLPEVAFAGRSNVGKSSLLNALLGQRQLAKVSSTPGRTRSINFFLIDQRFIFADLPGYGFARVPPSVQVSWRRLVDSYLRERQSLAGVMLLVDSRHEPHESDLQLAAFLNEVEMPFLLVATKIDKVSNSKRQSHLEVLAKGFGLAVDDILAVSSTSGDGIQALWDQIHRAVDAREHWLKALELWGVPSMKGPKAQARPVARPTGRGGAKAKAAATAKPAAKPQPGAKLGPAGQAGSAPSKEPKLTPLHPEYYKEKAKARMVKKKKKKPARFR